MPISIKIRQFGQQGFFWLVCFNRIKRSFQMKDFDLIVDIIKEIFKADALTD